MGFYDSLGIKPIINGVGTLTKIGGSLMDEEVLAAMHEAARSFVDIHTLMLKAGQKIAELVGCEAACITSGAAAGIAISAAACMTKGDAVKAMQLPDTDGMPDEALMLKAHRILYDQALSLSGAKIREIGVTSAAFPEQIEAAISEKTALFFYVAEAERLRGSIPLPEIAQVARKFNVPVVVDAAAELPPLSNIAKYLELGADLVVISGGKQLRGPQSSGLILGKKELIRSCYANNYPNYSIGRSMKLDKETIAGIVKAVELFVKQDYLLQIQTWNSMASRLQDALSLNPGAEVRIGFPTEPGVQPVNIPRLYATFPAISAKQLQKRLLQFEPAIFIDVQRDEAVVNPQCLKDGEVETVIRAIQTIVQEQG